MTTEKINNEIEALVDALRERDAAYAKIRCCVARLETHADAYTETRKAIADLAAILPENA
jgi:hypothetical protein